MLLPIKKLTAGMVLGVVSAFALGLLGGAPSANAQSLKLRLGHIFAVDSPPDRAAHHLAKTLEERSGGDFQVTIFPNGQIGGDEAMGRDLTRGTLDLAFLNMGALAGVDEMLTIHHLPFMVSNYEEADQLFYDKDGVIQTTLRETMAKYKMHALGLFENDFRAVTNSKHPVKTPEDLKNLRLRVPSTNTIRAFFVNAGAQAVTLPFPDLFTALQQGTVDGQDNGPILSYTSRLFEAQKYMTMLNHIYDVGMVTASDKLWQRLDENQRKVLAEAAAEAAQLQVKLNREEHDADRQHIADGGVEVIELTPEGLEAFKEMSRSVWEEMTPVYGEERIEALRGEIEAIH